MVEAMNDRRSSGMTNMNSIDVDESPVYARKIRHPAEVAPARPRRDDSCASRASSAFPSGRELQRRGTRRFHNQASIVLTGFFLLCLLIASWSSGQHGVSNSGESSAFSRILEEVGDEKDEKQNDENEDWRNYSCNEILDHTDEGASRCRYAKQCNHGKGIFASFAFCSERLSLSRWSWILSPFLIVWMVLLFRMLGSTAEDFFSPSLEMFSLKMGLPPRFAGVSLLALGNGAADVSATRNAITSDPQKGYLLSLGALTGASMFIGSVVAAFVVITAKGVPCRGALVRDTTALLVTAVVIVWNLRGGDIGAGTISLFSTLYLVFVIIVLVADIYHRAVVIPRMQGLAEADEIARQQQAGQEANEVISDALNEMAGPEEGIQEDGIQGPPAEPRRSSQNRPIGRSNRVIGRILTALSNYDNGPNQSNDGWGVDSSSLEHERPVLLHGANGLLNTPPQPASNLSSDREDVTNESPTTPYTVLEDTMCVEAGTGSFPASNWRGAWRDCTQELFVDLANSWREIFEEEDNMPWDIFIMVCEYPFTVLRKLTVAIPCEGYYCRATVATAMALSPLWFGFYMIYMHKTNLFWYDGVPVIFIVFVAFAILGSLIMRYAPGGEGIMALALATPIALYGFFIAATWIDFVSDCLVRLLEFLGIVCRIPSPIMGQTVLAWGNSMGDLSADITMARKGLANMAMTACFAGPVFNMLVGLSLGFSSLSAQTGETEHAVHLSPSILTGFAFIIVLAITIITMGAFIYRGRIPKQFGYVSLGIYALYMVTSLFLQFFRHDAN